MTDHLDKVRFLGQSSVTIFTVDELLVRYIATSIVRTHENERIPIGAVKIARD